jgi:hypothetical protein
MNAGIPQQLVWLKKETFYENTKGIECGYS